MHTYLLLCQSARSTRDGKRGKRQHASCGVGEKQREEVRPLVEREGGGERSRRGGVSYLSCSVRCNVVFRGAKDLAKTKEVGR